MLSTRYFVKGLIKNYFIIINISFLFVVLLYFSWFFEQINNIINLSGFSVSLNSWIIVFLMIIIALLFTDSTIKLKTMSKVYGFNNPKKLKRGK